MQTRNGPTQKGLAGDGPTEGGPTGDGTAGGGPEPGRKGARLPAGVYLLAFSLFAMGTAEFLLAGVLPAVAGDLDVPLSSAGFLITAFALGVVLGGPPFAVLSLR